MRIFLKASNISSDGSGGPQQIPARLKRVGCGIGAVTIKGRSSDPDDFEIKGVAFAASKVPNCQTVPSAETWGSVQAHRACNANVPVCPDAAYVGNVAATTDEARRKLINGKHVET